QLPALVGPPVVALVEHPGQRPPAGPPGQHRLVLTARRPPGGLEVPEPAQRGEVGGRLGPLPRRGQVTLARRAEHRGRRAQPSGGSVVGRSCWASYTARRISTWTIAGASNGAGSSGSSVSSGRVPDSGSGLVR